MDKRGSRNNAGTAGVSWSDRALARMERPSVRLAALRFLLVVGLALAFLNATGVGDFHGFLEAGNAVLEGAHIYEDTSWGRNTWPPVFSLLAVPLSLFASVSLYGVRLFWLFLNLAALIACMDVITRLVHDRPLSLRSDPGRGLSLASPALLIPLILVAHPALLSSLKYIQIYIILMALILWGLWADLQGRPRLAGFLLGFGAAIRLTPLVCLPYLIWRRRFRSAGWMAGFFAAFSLSPALFFGWDRFVEYVVAWTQVKGRQWGPVPGNQSVLAAWDRIIGHGLVPFAADHGEHTVFSGHPAVRIAWLATMAVTALAAMYCFRGPVRSGQRLAAEWSVVIIGSAIFAPITWKHYLVVLLLPLAVVYALWQASELKTTMRRLTGGLLLVTFLLVTLPGRKLVGFESKMQLEMASIYTWVCVALMISLFWIRRHLDDTPAA